MRPTTTARRLRSQMTDAEDKLWSYLRNRRLHGMKFRRQMPMGQFVADFACVEARLVIEVDGGQHAEQVVQDEARTAAIEATGYLVLRFWNDDVLQNIEGVIGEIERTLAARE